MSKRNRKPGSWFALAVCAACFLLAFASLLLTQTALAELPPRPPTPTYTPQPTDQPPTQPTARPVPQPEPEGGTIELLVQFDPAWPWENVHWQELWTVVQWQDEWGNWHDVEGWQGALDTVVVSSDGEVTGSKVWGVDRADLGKGPFRWVVLRSRGERRLAMSEPFYLPSRSGAIVWIAVPLALYGQANPWSHQ